MIVTRFAAALLVAAALVVVPAGPVPAVTHQSSVAAAATQCTGADLKASKGTLQANVGSRILDVFVTNTSDHSCQTAGFTVFRFRNSTGLIGWTSTGNLVNDDAAPVVLSPGQKAKSLLLWTDPAFATSGECRARHASGVRLRINDIDKFFSLPLDLRVCTTKKYRPRSTRLTAQ